MTWFETDRVVDVRTGDTGEVHGDTVRWDGGKRRPSTIASVARDLRADTEEADES